MKTKDPAEQSAVTPPIAQPKSAETSPGFTSTPFLKKLLVPIDFSDNSRRAVEYALSLARRDSAEVRLIFVIEPIPACSGMEAMPIMLSERDVETRCQAELAEFGKEYASRGTPISTEIRNGPVAAEVAASATENQADAIVISTHGYAGLEHVILGSVAEKVMREAPCPVFVVRCPERGASRTNENNSRPFPKKILVPTDFSQRSVEALKHAAAFAEHFGGEITLLHCIKPMPTALQRAYASYDLGVLADVCGAAAHRTLSTQSAALPARVVRCVEVLHGSPLRTIIEYARKSAFDLIACATHGRTGLAHAFLGSTAEGIIRHAPCPVLIFRESPSVDKKTRSSRMRAYRTLRSAMV